MCSLLVAHVGYEGSNPSKTIMERIKEIRKNYKIKKYIRFIKKDFGKAFGMKRKVLFGKKKPSKKQLRKLALGRLGL